MIDLVRIGELGKKGLLALMSDSTNVERPGYTPSEKIVGKSLEKFILESDQRIIIATFASNVSRLQQILDIAARAGRKVAVCGRSMEKISRVATELGYLKDTGKVMIDISEIRRYARSQLIIVSTGSQLSLIHISEPTRRTPISYAVFCLKKKKKRMQKARKT